MLLSKQARRMDWMAVRSNIGVRDLIEVMLGFALLSTVKFLSDACWEKHAS